MLFGKAHCHNAKSILQQNIWPPRNESATGNNQKFEAGMLGSILFSRSKILTDNSFDFKKENMHHFDLYFDIHTFPSPVADSVNLDFIFWCFVSGPQWKI
jgi:hypothetical protein